MSVELIRDILNYERIIAEGSSQTMVDGDIVIDEMNPDIDRILNVDGDAIISDTVVLEDKVLVEGKMRFTILYSSKGETVTLKKQETVSNFKQYVQAPMAVPNMSCKVIPVIEQIEYDTVAENKIKVNAIISLKTVVYQKSEAETVVDMKANELQALKDNMKVCEYVTQNNSKVIVKGKLELPQDKGEFADVVKLAAHVHKKDLVVQDGKLVVNACVLTRVLFTTNNGQTMSQDVDTAFTDEIMIDNLKPNMKCNVTFKVDDLNCEVLENELGERRILELQISIDICAKVYNERQVERLVDAYTSTSRFEFARDNINAIGYFNEGVDSQTLKERITIDDELEGIRDLVYVDVNPVITETKIVEDKVVCEGVLRVCAVYKPDREEEDLVSYKEEVPFKSTVSIDGARIDMLDEVEANVEFVSFDKASQREFDIKVVLEVCARLFNKMNIEIIKEIDEIDVEEILKNMPSLVLYTVQPKDTLWKIAKKYSTSIDDIVKLNDIENPEMIMPGMKLIIPKKGFMK